MDGIRWGTSRAGVAKKIMLIENLVSTIIPVHNRPAMLRTAVESVLAQTYRPIEVIIADDGSTDETPVVAKALVERYHEVIRYVRHENAGPGPARELGRKLANGEFIQYLDSDDRLLPNKFADQVAVLRRHPECDVAYGITRLVNQNGEVQADPFKWTAKDIPQLFPGLLVDRWWCTHTPLYRRSLTDLIGCWCDMRWSQDWEYDSRIGALRTKLVSCGTHVSEHVHHEGVRQTSSASWSTDPIRLRNRVRLMKVLWDGATKAAVPESAPERQHFARWCFSIGRNCIASGLLGEGKQCLDLAELSAGPSGAGRTGIRAFRFMIAILGPRLTSRLVAKLTATRSLSKHNAGKSTMTQSFADKSGE